MNNPSSSRDKAMAMLALMRKDYLDGLSAKCYQLEQQILLLTGSDRQSVAYEELFRIVHSLKGSGGTFGLPLITSICHYFEDLLSDPVIDIFDDAFEAQALAIVDCLHQIATADDLDNPLTIQTLAAQFDTMKLAYQKEIASVMVLESSKAMQQILQQVLAETGLKVTTMDDGLQALQRLLHEPYDLLIVSLELAHLRGHALISALQQNKGINSETPVIFLTSKRDFNAVNLVGVKVLTRSSSLAVELPPVVKALLLQTNA